MDQLADWERYHNFLSCFWCNVITIDRFVVLAFDEMKIRENLIFDKETGEITEFVDYREESLDVRFNELQQKCQNVNPEKREVATHMLVMMVQGLAFHLNLPIAQFAATGQLSFNLLLVNCIYYFQAYQEKNLCPWCGEQSECYS